MYAIAAVPAVFAVDSVSTTTPTLARSDPTSTPASTNAKQALKEIAASVIDVTK
jgi:hypothetical protein